MNKEQLIELVKFTTGEISLDELNTEDAESIVNDFLDIYQIPIINNKFLSFVEWTGDNYVRLHNTWVQKFSDQRKKDNYISTKELWKKYNSIFPTNKKI